MREHVITVRNLGIFILNLIQKIHSKLVTTCLCTCVILLLALVADMNMNDIRIIAEKIFEFNKFMNRIISSGGTYAQGTGGSTHTS